MNYMKDHLLEEKWTKWDSTLSSKSRRLRNNLNEVLNSMCLIEFCLMINLHLLDTLEQRDINANQEEMHIK